MKDFLRSVQTYFPFLHDLRFKLKIEYTRFTKNPHEYDFRALKHFKPENNQVFVDVGSNRGESIASMLACSSGEHRIIGFEPNPFIFQKLENTFRKSSLVELHNCGLGSSAQTHHLYVPFYRNWMFDGLSSFKYDAAKNWLVHRLWNYKPEKLNIKKVSCRICRLDDFSLNPYFIKIDVQGYELEVLKGAQNTIEKHKPILLIESPGREVFDYLSKLGYNFYNYGQTGFSEGNGDLNTFAMTKEHFELKVKIY